MAKMRKIANGHVQMDIVGLDELAQQLEHIAGEETLKVTMSEALKQGAEPVGKQMQEEMAKHTKPNGRGWSTGATYNAFISEPIKTKAKSNVGYRVGYSVRKGGLAAIFWQLGGAHIEPTMFMDKAANDNLDNIKALQEQALQRELDKLR